MTAWATVGTLFLGTAVFSEPAQADTDDAAKQAIVGVILTNLGVKASVDFITEIADEIPTDEFEPSLLVTMTKTLATGGDPATAIANIIDSDGDGVPNVGSALRFSANANSTATASDDERDHASESGATGLTGSTTNSTSKSTTGQSTSGVSIAQPNGSSSSGSNGNLDSNDDSVDEPEDDSSLDDD